MPSNRTHIATAALALALVACSSPKPGTPEFVQKKEDEQQKTAVKAVEQAVATIPSWVSQPPVSPDAWYEVGIGTSPDMQIAMDNATQAAQARLVFRLATRASGLMKSAAIQTGSSGDPVVTQEIERVTKIIATEVNIAGFIPERNFPQQDGKNYKFFALIRLPLGEGNKVIADQVKKSAVLDGKVRTSDAWKQLEKEIEEAKKK